MQGSEDLVPLFEQPAQNLGYRQGIIIEWDPVGGFNRVDIGGGFLDNLPVITDSNLVGLRAGDVVALLRYNTTYAILGRIQGDARGLGTPWQVVDLQPQFVRNGAASSTGVSTVNIGVLASWDSRIYATHHTHIEVYGVWGQSTGSNTTTFQVVVGGDVVGTWTETGTLSTIQRGPYSIVPYMFEPYIGVQVRISSSVGSGTVAIQPLACFLRNA